MTKILWDETTNRDYETGVDRGIIRSKSGLMIPWNGLRSVDETPENAGSSETFFDGKKIENRSEKTYYSASISGYNLPSQFDENHSVLLDAIQEIVGEVRVSGGLYLTSQKKREFDFCYRTMINDTDYKIHMVWDAVISQSSSGYTTLSDSIKVNEYKWTVYAIPPRTFDLSTFTDPFLPTSHFVVDTRQVDPLKLAIFETILYGTPDTFPHFPTQNEMLAIFGS